jgi:hypothetical protein
LRTTANFFAETSNVPMFALTSSSVFQSPGPATSHVAPPKNLSSVPSKSRSPIDVTAAPSSSTGSEAKTWSISRTRTA